MKAGIFMPTQAQVIAAVKSTVESKQGTPCEAPSAQELKGALEVTISKPLPYSADMATETAYLTRDNSIFESVTGGFRGPAAPRWYSFGAGPEF
jgi:hypothetical protein